MSRATGDYPGRCKAHEDELERKFSVAFELKSYTGRKKRFCLRHIWEPRHQHQCDLYSTCEVKHILMESFLDHMEPWNDEFGRFAFIGHNYDYYSWKKLELAKLLMPYPVLMLRLAPEFSWYYPGSTEVLILRHEG